MLDLNFRTGETFEMCDRAVSLWAKVPADLNCSGGEQWKSVHVDECVAPLVQMLQREGINMRGSCCGHGHREGYIHLDDGRALLVLSHQQALWYFSEGIPLIGK